MTPAFLAGQVARCSIQTHRFIRKIKPWIALYLVDAAKLVHQAERFRTAFQSRLPDTRFYFAMKSNSMPDISRILTAEGFGLDVSSGLELAAALETGTNDIIFSGPGKTRDELMLAAAHPDRVTLLMDSIGECRRLMAILAEKRAAPVRRGAAQLPARGAVAEIRDSAGPAAVPDPGNSGSSVSVLHRDPVSLFLEPDPGPAERDHFLAGTSAGRHAT